MPQVARPVSQQPSEPEEFFGKPFLPFPRTPPSFWVILPTSTPDVDVDCRPSAESPVDAAQPPLLVVGQQDDCLLGTALSQMADQLIRLDVIRQALGAQPFDPHFRVSSVA